MAQTSGSISWWIALLPVPNERGDVPRHVACSAQKKLAGLEIAGKGHRHAAGSMLPLSRRTSETWPSVKKPMCILLLLLLRRKGARFLWLGTPVSATHLQIPILSSRRSEYEGSNEASPLRSGRGTNFAAALCPGDCMHLWSKSCKRRRRRFLKQNDEDEPGKLRRRHIHSLDPEDIALYLKEQLQQMPAEKGLYAKWFKATVDQDLLTDSRSGFTH